jgi:hypothetical protein
MSYGINIIMTGITVVPEPRKVLSNQQLGRYF